jgi:hypothetical protein
LSIPAAAPEDLGQEILPGVPNLIIRVCSEVVGCIVVVFIFLEIETARIPSASK